MKREGNNKEVGGALKRKEGQCRGRGNIEEVGGALKRKEGQ